MATAPIVFEDVGIGFGDAPVLENLSFTVRHGETKVLMGETGTGKSVVLKLAIGLLRPDRGRVEVLGEEVSRLPEADLFTLRRRIGMVFQESALFDAMSVRDNVAYRLIEEGHLDEAAIEERVRACLSTVEMEDAIGKMPEELSGGMRRRVSIARALATQPEIMLYDSPTGGLDPITAATIMELIVKLRDLHQVTGLLVTHRLQDAYLLASHCWDKSRNQIRAAKPENSHTSFLVLHNRGAIFDGSAPELAASRDSYIRHFLQR